MLPATPPVADFDDAVDQGADERVEYGAVEKQKAGVKCPRAKVSHDRQHDEVEKVGKEHGVWWFVGVIISLHEFRGFLLRSSLPYLAAFTAPPYHHAIPPTPPPHVLGVKIRWRITIFARILLVSFC